MKTERVTVDLTSDLGESLPTEVYESDCDNENRSSQKSLPHKKRIPTKLKRASNASSTRSNHSKCYKCNKCSEQFPTQAALTVSLHLLVIVFQTHARMLIFRFGQISELGQFSFFYHANHNFFASTSDTCSLSRQTDCIW